MAELEKRTTVRPYRTVTPLDTQEIERLRSTFKTKIRAFTTSNSDIAPPQVQVGDGANVITTGVKARMYFPCGVTIYQWTILADASGSITFDLWVDSHANAPPTVADTITASAKPLLSSAQAGQSSALTGWITQIKAGSWLLVNVDDCTTIKQATLCLSCRKGL